MLDLNERAAKQASSSGGKSLVAQRGKEYMREIGARGAAKGGRAVVAKYGVEYMRKIGSRGASVTNATKLYAKEGAK